MINRALYDIAFSNEWGRQMRFITGPRQSGKTTLAQLKLKQTNCENLYYLWDLRSVRNRYKENELFFTADRPPSSHKKPWICFDEIHKMPKWKNIIKGIYDSTFENYRFIVTGSAKFDILRRVGDSLSGRYFTFHLFPVCLAELINRRSLSLSVPKTANSFIEKKVDAKNKAEKELALLLEYSGFPEPLCRQTKAFHSKWAQDYLDTVIKEDIGALTRIIDMEHLYDLYKILPEMVGSPISVSSLASHLELSSPTVKNYLKRLEDFYLSFRIYPYSKNIKRSLLKAPKCYLYDWTRVNDSGKRFENYIAVELNTLFNFWMDASGEKYALFYIRNKQKQETDFLITHNGKPWLLIETKYSDSSISKHHFDVQEALNNIPLIQLCRQERVCMMQKRSAYRISASRFLS